MTGNCGLGPFPVETGREQELVEYLTLHDFDLHGERFQWNDFASYADYLDRLGIGINIAPLVGHAPLRIAVMGMENRKPAAFELERMQQLLSSALIQGAWGLSTGLIYPPGCYASTDELIALAKILAPHKALFSSHIRNEGDGLMDALDEAIAIGRESGSRVQISHLKAMGRSNRGKGKEILEKLTEARAFGINISADQYPYDASATSLTAVVPQWALAGGIAPLLERLRTPELREKLQAEIGREMAKREGAQGIFISNCRSEKNRRFSGKSIAILAEAWECLPEEAVVRLLIEEKGAVGAIFFSMSEDDVATILADSQISVGSDGHGLNAADALGEATHPRSYGCFTRVLGRYVREENMLSLATAVHKMSGLPASRLGFTDRGIIRQGFAADLSLFDPATIGDPADYTDPHQYSIGIAHLLIAGEPVIWDHKLTGMKPGRVLRLHDR